MATCTLHCWQSSREDAVCPTCSSNANKVKIAIEALGFIPDLINALESDPDISDITQYTNEIYEARTALKELRKP